jgi:hypothetical protein
VKTRSLTQLSARDGVELWHSIVDGVEHFAVRFGHRRARTVATLEAAQALFHHHVRQGDLARAH